MNSAYSINPKRLMLLIRSYIYTNLHLILILTAVFSALLIIDVVINSFSGDSRGQYNANYFLLLFVSGFVITRRMGIDLHDMRKGSTWLLLPATTMEKFLTLLLLPTLILICGAAVFMSVMSIVLEQLVGLFLTSSNEIFNPFSAVFFKGLNSYLFIQALFILGVIYFKNRGMSRTFLSIFIYCVILVTFTFIAGKWALGEYISPMKDLPVFMDGAGRMYVMDFINKYVMVNSTWAPVISTFFYCVFPIVCWITAFFSLKEMEL